MLQMSIWNWLVMNTLPLGFFFLILNIIIPESDFHVTGTERVCASKKWIESVAGLWVTYEDLMTL